MHRDVFFPLGNLRFVEETPPNETSQCEHIWLGFRLVSRFLSPFLCRSLYMCVKLKYLETFWSFDVLKIGKNLTTYFFLFSDGSFFLPWLRVDLWLPGEVEPTAMRSEPDGERTKSNMTFQQFRHDARRLLVWTQCFRSRLGDEWDSSNESSRLNIALSINVGRKLFLTEIWEDRRRGRMLDKNSPTIVPYLEHCHRRKLDDNRKEKMKTKVIGECRVSVLDSLCYNMNLLWMKQMFCFKMVKESLLPFQSFDQRSFRVMEFHQTPLVIQ